MRIKEREIVISICFCKDKIIISLIFEFFLKNLTLKINRKKYSAISDSERKNEQLFIFASVNNTFVTPTRSSPSQSTDTNLHTHSGSSYPNLSCSTKQNTVYQVAVTIISTSTTNNCTTRRSGSRRRCMGLCLRVCFKYASTNVYSFLYRTANSTYVNMDHYLSGCGAWSAGYTLLYLIHFIINAVYGRESKFLNRS